MSLVAVCAVFGWLYIGSSLLTESLGAVAVVLVIGPLAAIVMGHYLRDRSKGNREDAGRAGAEDHPYQG